MATNWIDPFVFGIRRIYLAGVALTQRSELNFIGADVVDNPTTGQTDITIAGGAGVVAPTADSIVKRGADASVRAAKFYRGGGALVVGDAADATTINGTTIAVTSDGNLTATAGGTGAVALNTAGVAYPVRANSARIDRIEREVVTVDSSTLDMHKLSDVRSATVSTVYLPEATADDAGSVILVMIDGGTVEVNVTGADTIDGQFVYTLDVAGTVQAMFIVNAACDGWEAWPRA
jgi:hypothetical protein